MKKYTSLFLMAYLLMGWPLSAIAQEELNVIQLTETLVNQIKSVLNADNVMGKPIEIEGIKIIPIVSFGFGFGSGGGVAPEKEGRGAGGGGGGGVMPASLLIITKDGEIKVMPARKGSLSEVLTTVMPIIMEAVKARGQRMEGPKPSDSPTAEENLKKGGYEPLGGDQVRELLSGNTYRGSDLSARYPSFVIYYLSEEEMQGRSGDETDNGKWWIQENQYCRQWNEWGKGQENCKRVYKIGELVHWVNMDGKIEDVGVIESGNPDNL